VSVVRAAGSFDDRPVTETTMPGPVFIETERLELRTVEEEDVEFLQAAENHPEVRRYIGLFREPTSRGEVEESFEDHLTADDAATLLAVPKDDPAGAGDPAGARAGEPVGSFQLYPIDDARGWANLGLWLHPDAWGHGYATEATAHLLEYAFRERGLHRVSADALAPNEASIALLDRVGFVHEGTRREAAFADGEYVDSEEYGLLARDWDGHEAALEHPNEH
jgi:RimJ/RimL family protein N-acetyltransferase